MMHPTTLFNLLRLLPWSFRIVSQRVHIHYYYGIRSPKTIIGMVFWDLIP